MTTIETAIAIREIDQKCDIQVDGKVGQVVMIFANPAGRKVVEELWPDVRWTTDEHFAVAHSSDWLFTHVQVVKLPAHLEQVVALPLCTPDGLGMAVARALQFRAKPRRVIHYVDGEEEGVPQVNIYDVSKPDWSRELLVKHVPAGTFVRIPPSGTA